MTNQAGLVRWCDYDAAGNLDSETDYDGRALSHQQVAAEQLIAAPTTSAKTDRLLGHAVAGEHCHVVGDAHT